MRLKWDTAMAAALTVLAVVAPAIVALDVTGPLRIAGTLPLVTLVPGLALLRLIDPVEHLNVAILAVAVSAALDVVTSLSLLYLHLWSILVALVVLAVLTVGATAARPLVVARRTA